MEHTEANFVDTSEWVPVHTLPGLESCIEYYVNRQGQVKSTKGQIEKILKPRPNPRGYMIVGLTQRIGRKKVKTVTIHKLVAYAFLPSPPVPHGQGKGTCCIDHIDEDKTNNNVDNLRYVSPLENNTKKKYKRGIQMSKEEMLFRRRKRAREYMRRKRAEEKLAKIDKGN